LRRSDATEETRSERRTCGVMEPDEFIDATGDGGGTGEGEGAGDAAKGAPLFFFLQLRQAVKPRGLAQRQWLHSTKAQSSSPRGELPPLRPPDVRRKPELRCRCGCGLTAAGDTAARGDRSPGCGEPRGLVSGTSSSKSETLLNQARNGNSFSPSICRGSAWIAASDTVLGRA
jgi:hypothetical protein